MPSRAPAQRLRVPRREHIERVDQSDPLPYYYTLHTAWLFRQRLQLAQDLLDKPLYGRILEVGYGSGILLPTLAARASSVHAVDLHQRANVVRAMLRRERVVAHLGVGSVTALPYRSGSFDAVVCLSTLEHLHDDELRAAVAELRRVLSPEGVAVIGVPASGRLMDLLFHLIGFAEIGEHHVSTADDIRAQLQAAFRVDAATRLPSIGPPETALYTVFRCRLR